MFAIAVTGLIVGGIALLVVVSPRLTGLMLLVVPPVVLGGMVFGRYIRRMSQAVQDRLAEASGRVQETVGAMQTVQAFVRERHERRDDPGSRERHRGEELAVERREEQDRGDRERGGGGAVRPRVKQHDQPAEAADQRDEEQEVGAGHQDGRGELEAME